MWVYGGRTFNENGEVLVNEVAPRPHNSGHHTLDYDRPVLNGIGTMLDLPLGSTKSIVTGVMVNLVGAENHTGAVHYENIDEAMSLEGVTPYLWKKGNSTIPKNGTA